MPVVDTVAADYTDEVAFVAVAAHASFERTAARAEELFSDRIQWGLDESIWDLYGVPYQPVTVLITGDDVIVDTWPGVVGEQEIRERLDRLVALSG